MQLLLSSSNVNAQAPLKILGRGILNRDTKEVLQLACVGAPKENSIEASCGEMQFVYSAVGKTAILIGEKFKMADIESAGASINRKKIKKELKNKIIQFQKDELLRPDVDVFHELFPRAAQLDPHKMKVLSPSILGAGFAICIPLAVVYAGPAIACPAMMALAMLIMYAPFIEDLALLPMRLVLRNAMAGGFVESYSNVSQLGNRDLEFWQERAKAIRSESFRQFFLGFGEIDQMVLDDSKDQCTVNRVEYAPTNEWIGLRFRPSDEYRVFAQNQEREWFMSAPEVFVRGYSNSISTAEFGKKERYKPSAPYAKAEMQFEKILNSLVRKRLYVDLDAATGLRLKVIPHVVQATNSMFSSHFEKVKRFCIESQVWNQDQLISKNKFCDASVVVSTSKFVHSLPKCRSL